MSNLNKYQICELTVTEQRTLNGGNPVAIAAAIGLTVGFFWRLIFRKR